MVARIGLVVGIAVVGLAAYQVGTRWQVARVARSARNCPSHSPVGLNSTIPTCIQLGRESLNRPRSLAASRKG